MKDIQISGTFQLDNKKGEYNGQISFREDKESIYYTWKLVDSHNDSIAGQSRTIHFKQIPPDADLKEFTINHSIESIKRYRLGREKIILTLEVIEQNMHLT